MQDKSQTPWTRAGGKEPAPRQTLSAHLGQNTLAGDFVGRRGTIFGMAVIMGLYTILTLGLYRFWMKTRLRRWYWSSIRVGGLPLEYVGDPLEKLLGFLIAVVFLAFYIGIVNLLLMFASFSLFQGNYAAYLVSFVGIIPLWFYAQYRARRYVLARTRWRGLRFGLAPGAWGYALRALWHWALTIVTLGLLWPRMTFKLEQYRTDRTFFGDARLEQGGQWTMLFPALKWIFIALVLGGACGGWIAYAATSGPTPVSAWPFAGAFLAAFIALYGLAYYRVETLIRLTQTKKLNGARLRLIASPRRVLFIHIFGYLLAILASIIPLILLGIVIAAQSQTGSFEFDMDTLRATGIDPRLAFAASAALYFGLFLMWSALTQAFITFPLMQHYARGLTVQGADTIDGLRQRPRDEHVEAEGFAEALDVGASL